MNHHKGARLEKKRHRPFQEHRLWSFFLVSLFSDNTRPFLLQLKSWLCFFPWPLKGQQQISTIRDSNQGTLAAWPQPGVHSYINGWRKLDRVVSLSSWVSLHLPTEIQSLLFLTFPIHLPEVTLLGNSLIILVTLADPMLHSPMYFFLRNLSFLEVGFNLVIVLKILGTLIA